MNPTLLSYGTIYQKMRDTMQNAKHMKTRTMAQNPMTKFSGCDKVVACNFDEYQTPTEGMMRSNLHGYNRFCKVVYDSTWYPYPKDTLNQGLGMIQNEPPTIDLPPQLEFMKTNATANYESLEKVMTIVNAEQMIVSRVGLLSSPITGTSNEPFNTWMYKAEQIVDWNSIIDDEGESDIDWLVLRTDELSDDKKTIYQVFYLDSYTTDKGKVYPVASHTYKTDGEDIKYGKYNKDDDGYIENSSTVPLIKEEPSTKIPFVVINVKRLGYDFEDPFLEPVSDASIKAFQSSARHEDNLEHGGKSTMFTKGYRLEDNAKIFQGNGAVNDSTAEWADAKIVTSGTDGIEPTRKDLEEKKNDCVKLGFDLVEQGVESGVALALRATITTAKLKTLAKTGAEGVERLLKIGAVWIGANPDEVSITANTTFADPIYTLTELRDLWMSGQVLRKDIYETQKKQGLTTIDNFEDWLLEWEDETPIAPVLSVPE